MKFLAILKDSVREAIDAKVFYVLLGLSFLVILAVGSVSFERMSVEQQLLHFTGWINWAVEHVHVPPDQPHPPTWNVENFSQTNDAKDPWDGDYQFDFAFRFQSEADAKKSGGFQEPFEVQAILRQQMKYLQNVTVKPVESTDPTVHRFRVTTTGTDIHDFRAWRHQPVFLFAWPLPILMGPLADLVHLEEFYLVSLTGTAAILLVGVVVTSFFIPNMLRKGHIDLLLVKPITRPYLLLCRYVGGLSFVFMSLVFLVVGVWLLVGIRTGVWGPGFLYSIFLITFQFAILYAFSTFLGVFTRSGLVAIIGTVMAWGVLVGTGYAYDWLIHPDVPAESEADEPIGPFGKEPPKPRERPRVFPDWLYTGVEIVHAVLPRVKDLDVLTSKAILDSLYPPDSDLRKNADKAYAHFHWTETFAVSFAYIVVLLGLSCWWFSTRDY